MAGVVLVVAVVGDVATLICGHCCRSATVTTAGGGGWPSWTQPLVCSGLLASSLLVFAAACVLPALAPFMCQTWLAVHITWADDWARPGLAVLYDLQVMPVVNALSLRAIAADVQNAQYWWWFVQGVFMMGLVHLATKLGFDEDDDDEEEMDEEDTDMTEVPRMMVGDVHPPAMEAPQCHVALCPAMPRLAIEEIG